METTLRLARLSDTLWSKLPKPIFKMILEIIAKNNELIRPDKCIRCNGRLSEFNELEFPGLNKVHLLADEYFDNQYKPKLYYVTNDCASCT